MPGVLFKIPLTDWVFGTIEKMNRYGKRDILSWGDYWYKTYKELGGQSDESGSKGCPQHAAYGLWRLGRIKGTSIIYQDRAIEVVNQEYGKNAAYAVLALALLKKRQFYNNEAMLWSQVQDLYRKTVHEEPAQSQQGAVKVAKILFEEGFIVSG